jgi:signal transduction histidine kinase
VSDAIVFQADHAMVRVVLRNLLTNAIKFSHRGGAVSLHATEGDGWVSVIVRDNGVGIPLSRQETLFQRTERAQRGTANERGAGIGLSLAASFVERHGGHICVESEPGSGSAFQVDLPAVQPQ